MERAGYNPNEVVHGKWGGWEYTGTGADGVFSDGRYPSRGEYPPATIRLPSGQLFDTAFDNLTKYIHSAENLRYYGMTISSSSRQEPLNADSQQPQCYASTGNGRRSSAQGHPMTTIANALIPVLALILAGFLLQRNAFLPPAFWSGAEKLTYFLLMPATLIHSLAGKEIGSLPWVKLLATVEGGVVASALLVMAWWLINRRTEGPVLTSVFQGGVRFNTFVALALAENLYGREGLFLAAMAAGFMIILINILCVSLFSLTVGNGNGVDLKRFLRDLMRNPLIIACLIGVGINACGLKLPVAIDGILALGGKAAFPVGLMAVGAAYRAGNLILHWRPLMVSSSIQFLCKPLIAWQLATALGLTGVALNVTVLLFSVPTAPSAYILSRQMGGDHDSMAAIITVQTCLSFLTLPVTIWLIS